MDKWNGFWEDCYPSFQRYGGYAAGAAAGAGGYGGRGRGRGRGGYAGRGRGGYTGRDRGGHSYVNGYGYVSRDRYAAGAGAGAAPATAAAAAASAGTAPAAAAAAAAPAGTYTVRRSNGRLCNYFGTVYGCKNGDACRFVHDPAIAAAAAEKKRIADEKAAEEKRKADEKAWNDNAVKMYDSIAADAKGRNLEYPMWMTQGNAVQFQIKKTMENLGIPGFSDGIARIIKNQCYTSKAGSLAYCCGSFALCLL